MDLSALFVTIIYQPFLNILVLFYWILGFFTDEKPDMGIAVIFLTLLVRFLLLPLSLAGSKSETERRRIADEARKIDREHENEPIILRQKKKILFKESSKTLISEVINLFIQVSIALMLWKIFATGLSGADLHLIYSFMPDVETPFNLMFLGKYDLTHPHIVLNLIQTFLIFVLETLSVYTSPYPHTRSEVVRLQLVLPLVSFLIFMGLPAGKKIFVITTLCFSIVLTLFKAIRRKYYDLQDKWALKKEEEEKKARGEVEEKIVVEVKT